MFIFNITVEYFHSIYIYVTQLLVQLPVLYLTCDFKWKEIAKRKTELGNKVNFVHDAILKNQVGEQMDRASFQKMFKPITSKLDDLVLSNLKLPALQRKRGEKMEVPDYGIPIYDENIPDYGLEDLFDEEGIQPQNNKRVVRYGPPTYEETLADKLNEGKKIDVDPQYLPPELEDLPSEYDEDEVPDYALGEEDRTAEILKDLEITDYDNVDKILNQPEMTLQKTRSYLNKVIVGANFRRNQLKGYKSRVTQVYHQGQIGEAARAQENKRIDDARAVLNQYIKHYEKRREEIKGSGIRGKRSGGVMFFNNPKTLLKKLELMIGEIMAGNNSIKMRNMGVSILDHLLRTSTINKAQHNKLCKQYFNPN